MRGLAILNLHSLPIASPYSPLPAIIKQTCFLASFILQIQGLETGYSREVDGQVQLLRGPQLLDAEFSPQSLHFKLTDTSVRLLGRGLSHGMV